MIITRTPFRVSFVGGGSDLPEFYRQHGHGAVISAAIQSYMYIVIHPYFHDKIRIKYSRTEDVDSIDQVEHPIVRECLKRVGVERGVEIASFADVAAGTGLGSSSAFTVGLLHALYAYQGKVVSQQRLAAEACEIEIDILKEPIGKQDQYAAACGGVNKIVFHADERVEVQQLLLTTAVRAQLEENLGLYYVGGSRSASEILAGQKSSMQTDADKFNAVVQMLPLVDAFREALEAPDLSQVGALLHRGWEEKKKVSSAISSPEIDELYAKARELGAGGGKLLGAGGTGFLLLQHAQQADLNSRMACKTLPFKIDTEGSKLLFFEPLHDDQR
jgi:D-glycero-alpha-D-manno-heptose-7-phosphate kinase